MPSTDLQTVSKDCTNLEEIKIALSRIQMLKVALANVRTLFMAEFPLPRGVARKFSGGGAIFF